MDSLDFRSKHQTVCDQAFTKGRFKGKVAVVVGGASGIGFATAERFANDGATVAVVDIHETNGKQAEEYMKAEGFQNVKYYYANVTDKSTCEAAAQAIANDNNGVIHFLVNSAVYFGSQGLTSEYSDWKNTSDVNIYGTVAMVQACHGFMKNAGGGAIVNVSSISGSKPQRQRWTYSASKAAIKMMTKNMALDLAEDGIRVNCVSPGWIWTPEMAKASPDGTLEAMLPHVAHFNILKRTAETAEVASVATFLCARDSSYITGADIEVDGGYCAMGPERHGNDDLFAANKQKAN